MINEPDLIRQLQNEKTREQAFTLLVREYQEPLYWQIRRIVLKHDDSDDVLQNTFIKAWINLEDFRGESRIYTWLSRIAINEALNHMQRSRQNASLDDAESSVVLTLQSDPYFDGDKTQLQAACQATCRLQHEVLPGDEIRGHERGFGHQHRCPEGVVSSCREENNRIF